MIYFIGGAPRIGKTQLAKKLSEKTKLSWLSTDNLRESLVHLETINRNHPILRYWINWKDENYTKKTFSLPVEEIIKRQNNESKEVAKIVKGFVESIAYNRRDFILEGVALLPEFYSQDFLEKYKIKFACVGNTNYQSFLKYSWEHRVEGDWLNGVDKTTFEKTIRFCSQFSQIFKNQAKKRKLAYYEISSPSFIKDVNDVAEELIKKSS